CRLCGGLMLDVNRCAAVLAAQRFVGPVGGEAQNFLAARTRGLDYLRHLEILVSLPILHRRSRHGGCKSLKLQATSILSRNRRHAEFLPIQGHNADITATGVPAGRPREKPCLLYSPDDRRACSWPSLWRAVFIPFANRS